MIEDIKRHIVKNLLLEKHYRFSLIAHFLSLAITICIFFFIDKFFKAYIQHYILNRQDYFSYVFAAFIIFNYSSGNSTVIQIVNSDISYGIFEFISNRKNFFIPYMVSAYLYSFILATLEGIFYLTIASHLKIIKLNANFPSVLILLFISSAIFCAFAFINASFFVIFKKGNIAAFFYGIVESIFGAIYFPPQVLGKISIISNLIPITHSVSAVQKIIYQRASVLELKEFYILLVFLVISIPFSYICFRKAVNTSRKLGNLSHY